MNGWRNCMICRDGSDHDGPMEIPRLAFWCNWSILLPLRPASHSSGISLGIRKYDVVWTMEGYASIKSSFKHRTSTRQKIQTCYITFISTRTRVYRGASKPSTYLCNKTTFLRRSETQSIYTKF